MAEDVEINALVIKNIGDIEAAMKHAVEVVSPRVWEEAGKALVGACDLSKYHASGDAGAAADAEVWMTDRSWLVPDAKPAEADFWLGLDERTSLGGDGEESWLAAFTGSGPNGATMALWVDQSVVGKPRWKKIVRNEEEIVAELRVAGFDVVEHDDRRLCLPVSISRDALAAAFASEDFTSAMQPLADAVRKAIAATPTLQKLRAVALAAA